MRDDERRVTFILPVGIANSILAIPVGYRRAILTSLLRMFLRLEAERGLPAALDILDHERWELRKRADTD